MSRTLPGEIAKFDALADHWWDTTGPLRPLHAMNPCRLDFINRCLAKQFERDLRHLHPFDGLDILDVGCGGGLICEPMARLGAKVTGIDPAPSTVAAAHAHAQQSQLDIDYRCAELRAPDIAKQSFDVILAMEVVEHLAEPENFIADCAEHLNPSGILLCSTINRSVASLALAVIAAERLLRWLPVGTHDWTQFIKPGEFDDMLNKANMQRIASTGFVFNPLTWSWRESADNQGTNYALAAIKRRP